MNIKETNKGISNTIGTILLVGIVVALVALIVFLVFNFSATDTGQSSAKASVDLSATSNGVKATILKNDNVDEFIVDAPTGEFTIGSEPGDTIETNAGSGQYAVIAVLSDGSSKVIATTQLSETSEGFFVVTQYEQEQKAYAELVNTYDGVYEYDIIVDSEDSDGDTVSNEITNETQEITLSSRDENLTYNTTSLLGIDTAPGQKVKLSKNPIFSVANIATNPNSTQFAPNAQVSLHQMTNLCKGDEIHLINGTNDSSNQREVLAVGEEIKFNSTGCDDLRKVAKYEGNKIKGVKLINLWHQDLDYSVFSWNGDVPPPTRPVEDGSLKAKVKVYDNETDTVIGSATVNLADRKNSTNSSGEALFDSLAEEDITVFATAQKSGYYSNSTPVNLTDAITTQSGGIDIQKEVRLDPRDEQQVNSVSTPGPVPSGGSINIDFSRARSSASVSGGSGGGGGGGGGGGSFSGSGSGIYSTSSVPSTQTLSSPVESSPEVYVDIEQPDRQFNTIPIDDSLIPTGSEGEFSVRTSIKVNEEPASGSTVEDNVIIKAVSESGNDVTSELVGVGDSKTNQSVSLTPDEVSVVNQTFHFPQDTKYVDNKYTIFVTLESSSQIKTAGDLDVFNGGAEDVTVSGGTVSPENPTISSGSTENVNIEVDHSDINWGKNGVSSVTVDIFENGKRINQETIQNDSTDSVQYTREHTSSGYYDYHVGIRESQSVALAESVLVQGQLPSDINLSANISASGHGSSVDCGAETSVGNQFDCEILVGESIDLSGDVRVSGTGADEFNDTEVVWTWAEVPEYQERVYADENYNYDSETGEYADNSNRINWTDDLTTYSANDYSDSIIGFPTSDKMNLEKNNLTYNNSEAYIIELRISGNDTSQNQDIGVQDDLTLNVAKDPSVITSYISESKPVDGSDKTGNIQLRSERESFQESVDVGFFKVKDNGDSELIRTKDNVKVPREGDKKTLLEEFTISKYRLESESAGENVTIHMGLWDNETTDLTSYDNSDIVNKSTLEFEVVPEIVVDSTVQPIACKKNDAKGNTATEESKRLIQSLQDIADNSDFDNYNYYDNTTHVENIFSTPLDNVYVIDTVYWDSTNNEFDQTAINNSDIHCGNYK